MLIYVLTWPALAGLAAGCLDARVNAGETAEPDGEKSDELVDKSNPPVLDIPVPIGFDLDEGRSINRSGAGVRIVDHVYVGRADKFAVVRFYEQMMPEQGWKKMSYQFAKGRGVLSFEKDLAGYKEGCRITVDDGSWGQVEVNVELGPRGPASVTGNRN
jgi:hypothetical protein